MSMCVCGGGGMFEHVGVWGMFECAFVWVFECIGVCGGGCVCLVNWKKWVVLYKVVYPLPTPLHQDPPPMGTGTSLQHVVPLQTGKRGVALRHV